MEIKLNVETMANDNKTIMCHDKNHVS